jgi:hypothetical protein
MPGQGRASNGVRLVDALVAELDDEALDVLAARLAPRLAALNAPAPDAPLTTATPLLRRRSRPHDPPGTRGRNPPGHLRGGTLADSPARPRRVAGSGAPTRATAVAGRPGRPGDAPTTEGLRAILASAGSGASTEQARRAA